MHENDLFRLKKYNLELYVDDLTNLGLKKTWDNICDYVLKYGENEAFLNIANFGEMYEIGLAVQDKILKKKSGQYYTPEDIASVMGRWFDECDETNICDVACGTGKLILTYLELIGTERAVDLINKGRIFLYDFDPVALKICKTSLIVKYNITDGSLIHDVYCDFLNKDVHLPKDARVISNPPYAGIDSFSDTWEKTEVLLKTKELYSAFMEKVFKEAKSTVIITPFSFISGNKFYPIRKTMCALGHGFIVAFDNVPGNIFCGRKHGVFNTNTANSVRAAITVFHQSNDHKGFKVTPLIRFKNEERPRLLINSILEKELSDTYQVVSEEIPDFRKVQKELEPAFEKWIRSTNTKVKDALSKEKNDYYLDIPNTCRYYTVASHRKLSRTGSIELYAKNEKIYNFLYCMINSSFAYWWWRVFDGGITYPAGLLLSMPFPVELLSEEDDKFFAALRSEMSEAEKNYIITKMNAGVAQENVKFPESYRQKINERVLKILGCSTNAEFFEKVHANKYFK